MVTKPKTQSRARAGPKQTTRKSEFDKAASLDFEAGKEIRRLADRCLTTRRVENASINLAADEPQRRLAHAIKEYRALKSQGSHCPPERLLEGMEKIVLAIDAPAA
jgi:hypothetical protein